MSSLVNNNDSLRDILNKPHASVQEAEQSLMALRWWLLSHPCPSEVSLSSAFHSIFFPDGSKKKKLRGQVWKVLLRLFNISATCYINLVHRGPSPDDKKIRNDTSRTMTTDASFLEHVSEDMLIRVLNAFVWISRQGDYLSLFKCVLFDFLKT